MKHPWYWPVCWPHDWSLWERFEWRGMVVRSSGREQEVSQQRQKRHCMRCGHNQERTIIRG